MRQGDETPARSITSSVPKRHWRPYGTEPLPTPLEALGEPLRAFPSWFLRIECGCGTVPVINELHMLRLDLPLRALLTRIRHDDCGERAVKAELLTDGECANGRPVRRIVLMAYSTAARRP